ncbi:P63C domain-containing protein [Sphingobacterium sp. UT-1RO-CII-1]|uniref:P63C domain-containing protein n=1 Tax=Sphingobacterium sp. UT-1RO-CII-1 TaxID=2995225 RepID=UPI00227A55FC|nr:P63C domain-containing protein [Sphingobacterium sp. UT-1RO-CII-1]MCY4779083.1 P63C domain-containing protein [Sphingobacterium sp. UT-1RO-CII-1]
MVKKIVSTRIGHKEQVSRQEINLDKEGLLQYLIESTEALVDEKIKDEYLDRESEKILLTGGKVIDLSEIKRNLDTYFTSEATVYGKRFPQSFYDEIYRLNNWPIPKNKTIRKYVVARYTNEIIYMRFTKEGLLKLQTLNPYAKTFVRSYKHFQFLNDEGKMMLDQFIFEAIECMNECTTWYEFRLKYGQKYNLNVQMRLFEDRYNLNAMES